MNKKITIEGMSCGHCVGRVMESLKEICGVAEVTVSLEEKSAVVELKHDVEDDKFMDAIKELGYRASDIINI